MPLGRRRVALVPRMRVGCCGPKTYRPVEVQCRLGSGTFRQIIVSGGAIALGFRMSVPMATIGGKPSEGTGRTGKRASVVNRWYQVNSRVMRLRNNAASKPSSASRVRSGPTSGLPMAPGRKQDSLFEVHANQVLRASNAPGARPDQPREPRSFVSPRAWGQKGSSEMTYDPLILG